MFFSRFDSCDILSYMAFFLFFPFSHHHHFHVNFLVSFIYFPLEISSILYTTIVFVSCIWPYQIYVLITIIVSKECLWDSCIVPRNWKNPKFRLNVWKHTINNYGFTFFFNLVYLYFFPHISRLLVSKM